MRLSELLQSAAGWPDVDATIFVAQPWSCEADAIIIAPAPDSTEPVQQDGARYSYFLETLIARDVIQDYAASDEGAFAKERGKCERLIRYAEDDA